LQIVCDSRLQDITNILDQQLSIRRKLAQINRRHSNSVLEGLVDLVVVRHTSISHSLDDSVELELSGDIGFLLLRVVGGGYSELGGVVTAQKGEGGGQYEKSSRRSPKV